MRIWAETLVLEMDSFIQLIRDAVPDDIFGQFSSESLSDSGALEPPNLQANNIGHLNPIQQALYKYLTEPTVLEDWFANEQVALEALLRIIVMGGGLSFRGWQYSTVQIEGLEDTSSRNVYVLKDGTVIIARPKAKHINRGNLARSNTLLAFPAAIRTPLLFYLYVCRPVSSRILHDISLDTSYRAYLFCDPPLSLPSLKTKDDDTSSVSDRSDSNIGQEPHSSADDRSLSSLSCYSSNTDSSKTCSDSDFEAESTDEDDSDFEAESTNKDDPGLGAKPHLQDHRSAVWDPGYVSDIIKASTAASLGCEFSIHRIRQLVQSVFRAKVPQLFSLTTGDRPPWLEHAQSVGFPAEWGDTASYWLEVLAASHIWHSILLSSPLPEYCTSMIGQSAHFASETSEFWAVAIAEAWKMISRKRASQEFWDENDFLKVF
jgi:hypothetical protein